MSLVIVVGSLNPVKIEAVRLAVADIFTKEKDEKKEIFLDIIGLNASSEVPDQPWGDEQTLLGAKNR